MTPVNRHSGKLLELRDIPGRYAKEYDVLTRTVKRLKLSRNQGIEKSFLIVEQSSIVIEPASRNQVKSLSRLSRQRVVIKQVKIN